MSKKLYEEANISAIASAIRSKNGLSSLYSVSDMAGAILSISANPVLQSVTLSSNGEYAPPSGVDGFNNVVVSVSASAGILVSKNISANGTYNALLDDNADGYSEVIVSVSSSGSSGGIYADAFLALTGCKSAYLYDAEGIVSNISVGCYGSIVVSVGSNYAVGNNNYILGANFPACETIGQLAFCRNVNLSEAIFPVCSVIHALAFFKCITLSSVSFPECTKITYDEYGSGSPNAGAFRDCYALKSANFPKCSQINAGVFSSCNSLSEIHFSILETIPQSAFQDLYALEIVDIPQCKIIGSSAFLNYPYGREASRHNSVLSVVSFPLCSIISTSAFLGNYGLKSVYLLSNAVVSLGTNVFNWTPIADSSYLGYFGSVFVPASLVDAYKSATNWSSIADRITAYAEQ